MALKFRLRGLAETFIDEICCPGCGKHGTDDTHFTTENTRVTFEGIIVVIQCNSCGEIFVPNTQRLGVLDPSGLRQAVEQDCIDTGETLFSDYKAVKVHTEKLNTLRKSDLH